MLKVHFLVSAMAVNKNCRNKTKKPAINISPKGKIIKIRKICDTNQITIVVLQPVTVRLELQKR